MSLGMASRALTVKTVIANVPERKQGLIDALDDPHSTAVLAEILIRPFSCRVPLIWGYPSLPTRLANRRKYEFPYPPFFYIVGRA